MLRLITTLLATAVLAGCAARGPAGLDLDTSVTAVSPVSYTHLTLPTTPYV